MPLEIRNEIEREFPHYENVRNAYARNYRAAVPKVNSWLELPDILVKTIRGRDSQPEDPYNGERLVLYPNGTFFSKKSC